MTSVGNNASQNISHNLNINIGNAGVMAAEQSLTLRVGGNTLLINTQGIFINGMQVKVNEQS